ncbi:hypothetical protein EVA_10818, partial [gut metagenome]
LSAISHRKNKPGYGQRKKGGYAHKMKIASLSGNQIV